MYATASVRRLLTSHACRLSEAEKGTRVVARTFLLRAKLEGFSLSFFEKDPPLVVRGEAEMVCWATRAYDAASMVEVTVWPGAFTKVLSLSASGLRALWEEGVEMAERRGVLLAELNANLQHEFILSCSASVWVPRGSGKRALPRVAINFAECSCSSSVCRDL